jgi:hypothetical protein
MFILPPERSAPWVRPYSNALHADASAIRLQRERHPATSTAANAVETTSSRKLPPLEPQRPVDWGAVVGKVSIALKEKRSEARAAAWARTMEKLRSRQMALKERAPTGDASDTIRERDHRDHHQGIMRTEASQGA